MSILDRIHSPADLKPMSRASTKAARATAGHIGAGLGVVELTVALHAVPIRVRGGEEDSDSMLLCEWFQGAPPSVHVIEETIGLGFFGRGVNGPDPARSY